MRAVSDGPAATPRPACLDLWAGSMAVCVALANFCSTGASASPASGVPSHCRPYEHAYLNADLSEVHRHRGGYELVKTGNVVSLCADRSAEPFDSLTYRFGPPGKVEMERVGNSASRIETFTRSTSPHTGENVFFFRSGAYTYCVSEAIGMGSGVGLNVVKSGKLVLDLFSGNEAGTDFESELIELDLSKPRSPALHRFVVPPSGHTPCDPNVVP